MNALFAIKPIYAERIYNGSKKYEYRKYGVRFGINRIYLYETIPVGKITGYVDVKEVLKVNPTKLWEDTKEFSGITYEDYFKYYEGKKYAYVYVLGKSIKYDKAKSLSDFGLKYVPQSHVYIDDFKNLEEREHVENYIKDTLKRSLIYSIVLPFNLKLF